MSGGRMTKQIPEFIYFIGDGEWISGPYVNPKKGYKNRKFKITEVEIDEQKQK
jgi:hypothetical protein